MYYQVLQSVNDLTSETILFRLQSNKYFTNLFQNMDGCNKVILLFVPALAAKGSHDAALHLESRRIESMKLGISGLY